ncbi:unnamed protein product [Rhizophagus irregularis]|nr:unnamed protein product [Rhizophagus irregularis]
MSRAVIIWTIGLRNREKVGVPISTAKGSQLRIVFSRQTSKEFEPSSSIILEQLVLESDSLWEDTEGETVSTFASFSSRFLCLIPSLTLFLFTSSRKESMVFSSDDFELAGTVSFATMESVFSTAVSILAFSNSSILFLSSALSFVISFLASSYLALNSAFSVISLAFSCLIHEVFFLAKE